MATVFVCADEPAPAVPGSCVTWVAQPYEPSPWSLSLADAQSIGWAICAVWAAAWCFRALARSLNQLS